MMLKRNPTFFCIIKQGKTFARGTVDMFRGGVSIVVIRFGIYMELKNNIKIMCKRA